MWIEGAVLQDELAKTHRNPFTRSRRFRHAHNVIPYTITVHAYARRRILGPVTCPRRPNRREKGRVGTPQGASRAQRSCRYANGGFRDEAIDVVRRHRGSVILGCSLRLDRELTCGVVIAAVVGNWHNVLRAINMASSEFTLTLYSLIKLISAKPSSQNPPMRTRKKDRPKTRRNPSRRLLSASRPNMHPSYMLKPKQQKPKETPS